MLQQLKYLLNYFLYHVVLAKLATSSIRVKHEWVNIYDKVKYIHVLSYPPLILCYILVLDKGMCIKADEIVNVDMGLLSIYSSNFTRECACAHKINATYNQMYWYVL